MNKKYYKIGAVAKLAKTTTVTLRHYQKIDLLQPSLRSDSGYRLYSDKDMQRLTFILNAKAVGFSLKEIRKLIELIDNAVSSTEVKALINNKLNSIEEQIKNLKHMKKTLTELNDICDGTLSTQQCPIINRLH